MKPVVCLIVALASQITVSVTALRAEAQGPNTGSRRDKWAVYGYDTTADYRAFSPAYRERINHYKDVLESLSKDLYSKAEHGRATPCSRQILVEAHWLIHYTADFDRIERRLGDLREMLARPAEPKDAKEQSPVDGSYNSCCRQWFYKLDSTCDRLVVLEYVGERPKYPLTFLDKVNSPSKYLSYMESLLVSDLRNTGVDTRFELNLAGTDLVRLILGSLPSGYAFHPKLKSILLDFLDNRWQDPVTGFWGCWYKTSSGIRKAADLSMTFHIVHYRHGRVKRWPQIIQTVLAMRDLEYPYGWLQEGKMSNHHNYDVALLFHLGWPYMSEDQKRKVKSEVRTMLNFCLKESLRPDGSFMQLDSNTLGEAYEFPCLFLNEVGFFNRENRFWTGESFPEARAIAKRISAKIASLKSDDPEIQVAKLIVDNAD